MAQVIFSLMSDKGIGRSEWTLPRMLKRKGYATALIGKWHLGWNRRVMDQYYNPLNYGFDYFFGMPYTVIKDMGGKQELVSDMHNEVMFIRLLAISWLSAAIVARLISKRIGFTMALVSLVIVSYYLFILKTMGIWNAIVVRNEMIIEMPVDLNTITRRLIDEGQSFIRSQHSKKKPIFLDMSWLHVHTYLHPQPPFKGRSQHGPYGDAVEETDWAIGQIIQTLDELGISNNTLLYFSSDHGADKLEVDERGRMVGGWNGVFRGGKGDGSQEGGIRIPTCIQWTNGLPKGLVVSEPTSQMDLMPTLAAIVGGHMSKDRIIDGKNILPLLTDKESRTPHEFFFHYKTDQLAAIRYRPRSGGSFYKLHYIWPQWQHNTDTWSDTMQAFGAHGALLDPPRLFNVVEDPREDRPFDTNIEPYAGVVKRIEEARKQHEQTMANSPPSIMSTLSEFSNPLRVPFVHFAWQCFSTRIEKLWQYLK
ncbi:hypothetical protein CAPTEDRAFT_120576 [Capitella teleta]|uniref:Sulfatase N-terminal domain-containing protein n=1 Tax=Capitella teleta TaxID=283909 RepID=R7UXD2_CAPTE|nr:hypothetical protein CAPTEDRAFT_120576 [Capitella teleta]|eukprot:ELU11009.1 hypothetical protein CAPTEDRAFT_120576 [Capitella teleta]